MTSETKRTLGIALVVAIVSTVIPITLTLVSGLVEAPKRLVALEAKVAAMERYMNILVLMRCIERQGEPVLYKRLGCETVPEPTPARNGQH